MVDAADRTRFMEAKEELDVSELVGKLATSAVFCIKQAGKI